MMVTSQPMRESQNAAAGPAMPAPAIRTFRGATVAVFEGEKTGVGLRGREGSVDVALAIRT